MEKNITQKSKFPFSRIAMSSLLVGIVFGSQLSWSGIEDNDGGEFWYRVGSPENGPIVYNFGLIAVDLLVWTSACAILAFIVLSILMWIINCFKATGSEMG
jgi:hypothetical protein